MAKILIQQGNYWVKVFVDDKLYGQGHELEGSIDFSELLKQNGFRTNKKFNHDLVEQLLYALGFDVEREEVDFCEYCEEPNCYQTCVDNE